MLSQMITSQDLAVPVTLPRVKAKTGGRRGRGGRRPAIEAEGQVDKGTAAAGGSQVEGGEGVVNHGKGRGRRKGGGRPRVQRAGGVGRGLKRKRRPSDDEEGASKDDTDASETFTPLPAQSRSGRRIFKATAFTPAVIDLEANSASQPPVQNRMSGAVDEGKKGKKRHRKPGEASVCKNCGRGHSPGSNMIVFCDGCDTPWHQHCHDPRINAEVVRIEEMEWFCADCELLKEAKAQVKGKISSEGMTMVEVRVFVFSPLFLCFNRRLYSLPLTTHNTIETPVLIHPSALSTDFPPAARYKPVPRSANIFRYTIHCTDVIVFSKGKSPSAHKCSPGIY